MLKMNTEDQMTKANKLNILVITPSLDPTENISGISSVVRLIIEKNKAANYIPFIVGKKDQEKKNFFWVTHIFGYPFRLFNELRKKVYHLGHFNIAFEPKSLVRDWPLFCLFLIFSMPVILHVHGGRYMNKPAPFLYKGIIQFLLRKSRAIIVLSDLEKNFLIENYQLQSHDILYVLSTAVSLPIFSQTEKINQEGHLNILFLGRLDRKKGLYQIAQALNRLAEEKIPFNFYLCGIGNDKDYFIQHISKNVLKYIYYKGLVQGNEKESILKKSHIFLLPSFFEGLPVALLESMGYYMVPIVTPVGSIPKVVNKENGFLVSTTEDIVNAIKLLNEDRSLLCSLGKKNRNIIENIYSAEIFVHKLNQIIKVVTE